MYNVNSKKARLFQIFPLLLIPFVGLGGIGFAWYYPTQLQPADSAVIITYQKPMVLGAQTEKNDQIEKMFYQEPDQTPQLGSGVSTEILPPDVDDLFSNYCEQETYQDDLQNWFCNNKDELENTFSDDIIYTE